MDDNLWHFDSELSDSNIYVYTIEIPEEQQQQQFVDLVVIQNVTELQEIPTDWRQMGEMHIASLLGAEQTTLPTTAQGFPIASGKLKISKKIEKIKNIWPKDALDLYLCHLYSRSQQF